MDRHTTETPTFFRPWLGFLGFGWMIALTILTIAMIPAALAVFCLAWEFLGWAFRQ